MMEDYGDGNSVRKDQPSVMKKWELRDKVVFMLSLLPWPDVYSPPPPYRDTLVDP